jgi:hypothetical protein
MQLRTPVGTEVGGASGGWMKEAASQSLDARSQRRWLRVA